ncbi:hypothetical protein WA026_021760 [Henosepilachna vigintioctopunctata]|uniref:Uncharacterized protein n=1 Tax=Henosepilachna vigintioctopunctata TaxID=420089 RepID=A0AAW1TZX1_9CUCU
MNAYLFTLNASVSDRCTCGEVEDWMHVLFDCVEYADIRERVLGNMTRGRVENLSHLVATVGRFRNFASMLGRCLSEDVCCMNEDRVNVREARTAHPTERNGESASSDSKVK